MLLLPHQHQREPTVIAYEMASLCGASRVSTAPSPCVLWTVNFRFWQPKAQGHEPPGLLQHSVASHIWDGLTRLTLPYLLRGLCAISLRKLCKAKWCKTYMCQGDKAPPFLISLRISATATYAYFDENYGVYELLDTSVCHVVIWERIFDRFQ